MAHNYILQVTAGPSYDPATHRVVEINKAKPMHISSDLIDVDLNVRIQDYRGLPKDSPRSSPYFAQPPHDTNKDQYSIAFRFRLAEPMSADDLVFGNDFDHPIRDRLPPGFGTALRIVRWGIDPGLDGDPYADEPYLYGPLASSINTLSVGAKGAAADVAEAQEDGDEGVGIVATEGGDEEGLKLRHEKGVPDSEAARRKFFLNEANRKEFEFEEGRVFTCDFFNAYLDFNDFALRLPGFTLPIMRYWDGQGLRPAHVKRSHSLRYVLKNRKTNTELFVVVFTLYLKEDVLEDGSIRPGVVGGKPNKEAMEFDDTDEKEEPVKAPASENRETSADDVD